MLSAEFCVFKGPNGNGSDAFEFVRGDRDSFGGSANQDANAFFLDRACDFCGIIGLVVAFNQGVSAVIVDCVFIFLKGVLEVVFECEAGMICADVNGHAISPVTRVTPRTIA